ncbi:mesoderm induction early response protein 1 [Contarinia nasturtii]|uniref:mesoderm induction early response protein 1 n=1 Tax=Contarinia nasturtii TaxID=265458 RepID=UPI0012D4821F|nr:mesoderm induction early response protein 1 [Contarinia nasturtii]
MASRKSTNDSASSSRGNRSTSKDDSGTDPNTSDDKLFEPSLEMMVNDFDDESTLELEEKMASTEAQDPNAELNSLQKEGDMPIEELLALYNCVTPPIHTFTPTGGKRKSKTSRNAGIDKTLMPPPDTMKNTPETSTSDKAKDEQSEQRSAIAETETTTEIKPNTDTPVKDEEIKEETPSEPSKNVKEEDESVEKVNEKDRGQSSMVVVVEEVEPTKTEIKQESNEISCGNDKENNSKNDNQSKLDPKNSSDTNDRDEESDTKLDSTIIKNDEIKKPNEDETVEETLDKDEEESEEEESELKKLYPETYKTNEPRLLRASSQPNSDDEEEEDIDYSPEEDEFKKKIMVGSEYQAQIPEGLCRYDDALPYENEDKLVWDPSQLQECDIESYLQKASIPVIVGSPSSQSPASPISQCSNQKPSLTLPNGVHLRDDEGSLFLLLQCGHNTEEALRRRRLNATIPQTAVAVAATASNQSPIENTLWSEEECRNFESGLRVYGKDFHAIQQSKVRTRSVSELVQFYYLWKKTERHDIFANKARLEKKKYNLHPGLTDYMDRFLEEQENNGGISINTSINNTINTTSHGNSNGNEHASRDRSMSPVINSLLYTDCKRQRMSE